ncbi:MAG: GlsB/YeaQ/YmgE family stress response membrane protein [Hyphomicrobiales bacterium]|nr:GlsB/YeaQ/YmgE family stress response membrane protein [Hyphomicrobiales bacterium]MDE2016659.1 GlsB/YeaQ/YmgE family stress response membrane protein [Hyphomicrobiales bacterium]
MGFMGHAGSGMGFFTLIIVGGLAGWIAGMITGMRHGLFTNILIGIVGSWIGTKVAAYAHVAVYGSIRHLLAAIFGAIVVLYVWQLIRSRQTSS